MNKIYFIAIILTTSLCGLAQENINVKFSVNATSLKNVKNFGVRGSTYPLSWDKTFIIQDIDKNGVYEGELTFVKNQDDLVEYKFVYGDKNIVWELEGQNRFLLLNSNEIQLIDEWNVPNEIDINNLPEISSDKLSADFNILKKVLLEIHPGLHRYRNKNEMDSIFNHFQNIFSHSMSYQDAFLNFTKLTSAIQCGHTFPSFYNQNGFIKQVVLNQKDKLPFAFRVLDGRMIITENVAEGVDLPRGTEVLAIDGIAARAFLKETASLVKADGTNDAKRYADLNTFGVGDYFEMFDMYFPLLYPPENYQYTLKIRKPSNENEEDVVVGTMGRLERRNNLKNKNPGYSVSAGELWRLEFWENNTAYLQLGTFDGFQLSFEWNKFLKNAFEEIKKRKTDKLVIDIRWNEGGQDDILLFLWQNIAKKTVTPPQRQDLVRYDKISEELKPYLSTWDNSYFDLTQKVKPYDGNYFSLLSEDNTVVKPFANAFKGDIYLLINAANSSATFYLAEIAKENKLATLIGETTGGSQKGLNAGTMFFLRLPFSKIEIDIPIVGTFSNDKPIGGIVPDVIVSETVEDIIKGEDKIIMTTRKLINEK